MRKGVCAHLLKATYSAISFSKNQKEGVRNEVNSLFYNDSSQRKLPSSSVNAPKSAGFKRKFKDVNSNSSKITGDV